ncbi:hypothetical protein [Marinomonas sp.]|jgi:hypothetical protein|uniref:hypothetical protein n=1 Tax=Marinomonas sp. TaxID=1904862 RepID=UPI003A92AD23
MKQKFEKLSDLKKNKNVDRQIVNGFTERQAKREAEYQARAKRNAPTDQFYARSYNL